jgi:hypothetical protein
VFAIKAGAPADLGHHPRALALPGDPISDLPLAQTLLPAKLGGIGIIDLPTVAPLSFYFSLANAYLHFKPCVAFDDWTGRRTIHDGLAQHSHNLLPSDPTLEAFHAHNAQHSPAGLQRKLTNALHDANYRRLVLQSKTPADHARILACSAPYASAVLHTIPTQPALCLDDGSLRLALRLRLGLPPFPASIILPLHCSMAHPLRDNPTRPTGWTVTSPAP